MALPSPYRRPLLLSSLHIWISNLSAVPFQPDSLGWADREHLATLPLEQAATVRLPPQGGSPIDPLLAKLGRLLSYLLLANQEYKYLCTAAKFERPAT